MRILTISAWVFGAAILAAATPASAIDVNSLSSDAGLLDTWMDGTNPALNLTRNGGTVSLSGDQSPDGDGSLRLYSPDSGGKATAVYFGSQGGLGRLRYLQSISYQYYRDSSSTNPASQAPSLRLYVSDGSGRVGTLVYEPVYNGVASVPEDSWQTVDAFSGNWWLFEGGVFENFSLTLADWLTDNTFQNSTNTASAKGFGNDAMILGLDIGIGSGWAGESLAYVDHIALLFKTDDHYVYGFDWNFQGERTDVPETASLALLGAGLAGVCFLRRRGAHG